jgi:hypothetical protein
MDQLGETVPPLSEQFSSGRNEISMDRMIQVGSGAGRMP